MPAPSQHAFAEKVALVTDGTNPVGRAVAMQLALYGSYVVVGVSKAADEEKRALEELRSLGTLAHYSEADVTTVGGAKKLVAEVEKLYGRLDLLVNCVNFESSKDFEGTTKDDFDNAFDAVVKSAFFVTQEALRLLKPRPKARIVNIVAAGDSPAAENDPARAAANAAVAGLTKNLAKNLPEKFRVNAVAVSEKERRASHFEKFDVPDADLFRVKKGVDTDDVARTVLFLLSSEAVGINGQILKVE
jgi:3-oxoacyl-[acyl-carrier protein] reductase